jgi:hypothetical protein
MRTARPAAAGSGQQGSPPLPDPSPRQNPLLWIRQQTPGLLVAAGDQEEIGQIQRGFLDVSITFPEAVFPTGHLLGSVTVFLP